jgi:hypothetical protein
MLGAPMKKARTRRAFAKRENRLDQIRPRDERGG